jgi:hypothetical protein
MENIGRQIWRTFEYIGISKKIRSDFVKKLIACVLVCLLIMTFSAPALAAIPPAPMGHHVFHHAAKNPSWWMKYGRFALGAGILAWIIIENSHKAASTPEAQAPPEVLPGDRALHNVYGDNIPQR